MYTDNAIARSLLPFLHHAKQSQYGGFVWGYGGILGPAQVLEVPHIMRIVALLGEGDSKVSHYDVHL